MKRLRPVQALAALLCGLAILGLVLGHIRLALATIIVVLFLILWSLEVLRFQSTLRREKRP